MSNTIVSDVQKLDLGAEVDLYVLDLTTIGVSSVFYFHPGVNVLGNDVTWNGQVYTRWPMEASGFELSGKGILPRPKITVANPDGSISALCALYQDMVGAKITRHKTLLKYLDAVNFVGGVNPTADPNSHYADEVYFINRKMEQNPVFISFELTSCWDVTGQQLPSRQIIKNSCTWVYRGAECGYAGTNYWDVNDVSTLIASQDSCGKRLGSCKLRFGAYSELPYGGFPAVTQ